MELRNILTFIQAAENGSFVKASSVLGYAQSTVTTQIHQLEAELGQPLFDRIGRSILLTAFGREFLPLARQMQATAERMNTLGYDPKELPAMLRIGIVESMLSSSFLQLIPKYQEMFPKVILDFCTASSSEICEMLERGELDIGCCLAESVAPSNFKCFFAKTSQAVFVAANEHKLPCEPPVPMELLAKEPFVLTEQHGTYNKTLIRLSAARNLTINTRVRLKNPQSILEVLRHNGGISFLPFYTVRREVERGELRVIPSDLPEISVTAIVIAHPDKWVSPQMQALIDLLKTEEWL